MATFKITDVSNIKETSVKLTVSVNMSASDTVREEWDNIINLKTPSTASSSFDGNAVTITGLSSGSSSEVALSIQYQIYTLTNTSTEIKTYYFTYWDNTIGDWIAYSNSNLTNVASEYIAKSKITSVSPIYDDFVTMSNVITGSLNESVYYLYVSTQTIPSSEWKLTSTKTLEVSKTIYTKPKNFYFNGTSSVTNLSGKTWKVNEGIQTLLTNIYNFNKAASSWKNWKNQTAQTECSAFSKGDLTAAMLNNAYTYLGKTTTYKTGDIVSAKMFAGLEDVINGTNTATEAEEKEEKKE